MAFFRTVSFSEPLPTIEGNGVFLRAPQMSDYSEWATLREASRAFLTPWYTSPVTGIHDLDGNGVSDWALGLPTHAGARGAYTLGGLDSAGNVIPGTQVLIDGPQGKEQLLDPSDWFGSSLAFLGNLDGIGEPEIAVGARGVDDGTNASGAVWIGAIR